MNPFDTLLIIVTAWLALCILGAYLATRPIKVTEPPADHIVITTTETWDEHADRVLSRL